MAWANFDFKFNPNIIITFNKNLEDDEELTYFLNQWITIINKGKPYSLIIDTKNLGIVNLKFIVRLKEFLAKIKLLPQNKLLWTIVIINNNIIKTFVNLVLKFQKPLSKVYLTKEQLEYKEHIINIQHELISDYTVINP